MRPHDIELVRSGWAAFGRGDVEATLTMLDPQVRWHAAGDPDAEGACHSRDDAEAFIRRALAEGVTAELLDVRDAGEHLVAVIRTHNPDERDSSHEPHGELVTVRDGKVTEMLVYPTVADALAAAGLPAES